jgi:hypothetical protein
VSLSSIRNIFGTKAEAVEERHEDIKFIGIQGFILKPTFLTS